MSEASSTSTARAAPFGFSRTIFWKVILLLGGVQVATVLLAVGLSAWFAYHRSLDLVANSLAQRLDAVAVEVEQRTVLLDGLRDLPESLRLDLAARFPDPVFLLSAEGAVLDTLLPAPAFFDQPVSSLSEDLKLPADVASVLEIGEVVVRLSDGAGASWGIAPVYDAGGLLVGGLLVQPMRASLARELAGTRDAFIRALIVVAGLAGLVALGLGAFLTWRLVRPLRSMTRQVERIGGGDYAGRLAPDSRDELGRLASAINQMAEEVEQSVAALRATDQQRRELIANVGHDLRTPLAALLGYAEEASRHLGAGRDGEAANALEAAARQGHYLSRLVADLFELSLLDAARPALRREPIPLKELLTDAARGHQAAFERAGIAFDLDLPETLPLLQGDGVRLLRALDNLLANACRHTPAGGRVSLRARVVENDVYLQVRDTGGGLAPAVRDLIFERYYRGGEARTRTTAGTGLGLPISRAIARAHGGDLTVESAPGSGSTFTLTLPSGAERENAES